MIKRTNEEARQEGVLLVWRVSVLTDEICATEGGVQNIKLFEYNEKNLVVIRKKWSLEEDVMDFGYLSTGNTPGTARLEKNFN